MNKAFLKQGKFLWISGLISVVVIIILLVLILIPAVIRKINSKNVPALPNLTNQPGVLVKYIHQMNENALDNPTSDEAIGNLAMTYEANFFYEKAKICFKKAQELNPKKWRWIYYSALIDEELGDTKSIIDELKHVLQLNPDISQAWFRIGNAYLKIDSCKEAENAFNRVLKLKEFYPQNKNGIEFFNNGAFPLKAYASFNLARTLFVENKLENAKTLLEKLIEENPTFGSAYRLLGNIFEKMGDKNKSTDYEIRAADFESYVPPPDPMYDEMVLYSRNIDFLNKQIQLAVKCQSYEWTLYLINHVTKFYPDNGDILIKRIELALDMKRLNEVESLLPEFLNIYGSNEKKIVEMAKYFVFRGQYELGTLLLKKAVTIDKNAIDAHIEFINILTEFKQYTMGSNYCKELISIEPENPEIRNKLANIYIEQNKLGDAKQQIAIAQKLSPNKEIKFILFARISKKEKTVQSALDYYQDAINENPRNINTRLELGNYLLELHKWNDALRLFKNSLKLSPNDIDLMERYAWILAACPDDKIRDGRKALDFASRLRLVRKVTFEQDIRCNLTYAVVLGELKKFKRGIDEAKKIIQATKAMKMKNYESKLNNIISLYEANRPYRL